MVAAGAAKAKKTLASDDLFTDFPIIPARTSGKIAPVIKRRADNRTIDFRFRPSMVLAMPRKPSYFSSNRIGDLIGKLDVLRVECDKCGLRGSCRVPRSTSLRI